MHTARVRVAIARRSPPSYPWRPERAQPGVSKTVLLQTSLLPEFRYD